MFKSGSDESLKRNIIETSMRFFTRDGIKSVRMDDIALSMGISKRTLYEMVGNKESLLMECIIYFHDIFRKDIDDYVKKSDNILDIVLYSFYYKMKLLQTVNFLFFQEMCKYPRVKAYMAECDQIRARHFVEGMRTGVEQGLFREDVDYDILEWLVSEQLKVLFESDKWKQYTPADIFRSIVLVSIRGIVTPKGSVLLEKLLRKKEIEMRVK